jgi:hypothetical protein
MVNSLKIGDHIRITGGKREGKMGTIKKINATRHWVTINPNVPGNFFVAKALCKKIASRVLVDRLEPVGGPLPSDDVPNGDLSTSSEEEEEEEGEEEEEEEQSTRFGG